MPIEDKRVILRAWQLGMVFYLALVIAGAVHAQSDAFEAVHIERSRSIQLAGTPDRVFPLFEPEGRRLWASGWSPEFLFTRSDESLAGTVFRTQPHGHDDWTTWVVAEHDPRAKMIRYVIFIPEVEAWELEIRCVATPHGETVASVEYRVTALSEEANHAVQSFFANRFEDAIDSWGSAINAFLKKKTK
jgi:hypothetical protein